MAASERVQNDGDVILPVELNTTSSGSPAAPPPQRVANGGPSRLSTPPPDDHDGKGRGGGRLSGLLKQNPLVQSLSRLQRRCDYTKISMPEERANHLPNEWWKTGVAFLYAIFNLIFTTVVITIVHERVPDKSVSPPLPDKFFDYVDRVPWAFTVTETNGLILVGFWLVQWILLKHKYGTSGPKPGRVSFNR